MELRKVYDELYGMIEDLKRKVGKGGSAVTITPSLQSGEKVADYSIDGTEGAIYAPFILMLDGNEHRIGKKGNDDLYCKYLTTTDVSSSGTTILARSAYEWVDVIFASIHDTGNANNLFSGVIGNLTNSFWLRSDDTNGLYAQTTDAMVTNGYTIVTALVVYTKPAAQNANTTKKKK